MQDRDGASGFNPKHRIIGAVILVIAAVVAVPLLLNREAPPEPPTENVEGNATVVDVPPLGESPAAPVTAAPAPLAPAPIAPAPIAPDTATVPSTETKPQSASGAIAANAPPASAPAATQKPAPIAEAPKPSATRTPAAKGWYVQVGTFSNEANAKALAARLKARGYKVRLDDARVGGKRALRVQVGPYSQNAAATRARQEIERKLQVKGVVRAL